MRALLRIHLACALAGALSLALSVGSTAPVQLTRGPGDDTEAAWSPDGRRIVFQTARDGDADLMVLTVATGAVRPLVTGPGDAVYPAWSPDSREIAYSFGHFTTTVFQGQDRGFSLMLVPASGGSPRRLTDGLVRDYCPTFSRDGRALLFSSTRGLVNSAVGLYRLDLATAAATPELLFARDADDCAAVQPTASPDGRLVAFGFTRGGRANWTIQLLKLSAPGQAQALTEPTWPCYGPRWSPDGRWLACTAYQPGDPGWSIYVIDARTGGAMRLDTGPGNSRSPAWSPDSAQLVFENNRTGSYKLYRFMPTLPAGIPKPQAAEAQAPPVLKLDLTGPLAETIEDGSGFGNHARVVGPVSAEDGLSFGADSYLSIPQPRGFDFGRKSFSVRADLRIEQHTQSLRMVAVGDYPICRRGWQFYLDDQDRLWFSARAADSTFVGAHSDGPLPVGARLTVTGIRDRAGSVELFINGVAQAAAGSGAGMAYPPPTEVRVGLQYDGSMPATGLRLFGLEVHPMRLLSSGGPAVSLEEFLRP